MPQRSSCFIEEEDLPAKFAWPAQMEALQSLHMFTSCHQGSRNKQAFLHLDKCLPAFLPPSLCLTMRLYPFFPTGTVEKVEKDTIVEVILRIMNRNFDTASLKTLLRDPKRRMGTDVKISILIDYRQKWSKKGSMKVNQMISENLCLFRAALEIVPEFGLEVAVIDTWDY